MNELTNTGDSSVATAVAVDSGQLLAAAACLHLSGHREEALATLDGLVALPDAKPEQHYARARLCQELHRYEDAVASYRTYLKGFPDSIQGRLHIADCLQSLNRWHEAAEAFHSVLDADPGNEEGRSGLALSLLYDGRPEEALDIFGTLSESGSNNEAVLFGKAVALQSVGELDEAVTTYERVLALDLKAPEPLVNLIVIAKQQNDREHLCEYANRLLRLDGASEPAHQALAYVAFSEGDFQTAASHCARAAEGHPERYENWLNLGLCEEKSSREQEALEAYRRAVDLRPDAPQAHVQLGVLHQVSGRAKEAIAHYEKARQADPTLYAASLNLAALYEESGAARNAEEIYRELASYASGPEAAEPLFRLGLLRLAEGRGDEATREFEACLELRPDWTEAALNLGFSLYHAGHLDRAKSALEEALANDPNATDALRGLATIALEQDKRGEALELHRRLIRAGEVSPEIYHNAGLLAQNMQLSNEAEQFYRRSLELNPGFTEALVNLGHVLLSLGKAAEARDCWCRAIEKNPSLAVGYFVDEFPAEQVSPASR